MMMFSAWYFGVCCLWYSLIDLGQRPSRKPPTLPSASKSLRPRKTMLDEVLSWYRACSRYQINGRHTLMLAQSRSRIAAHVSRKIEQ